MTKNDTSEIADLLSVNSHLWPIARIEGQIFTYDMRVAGAR